ncbi:ribokinase [Amphibacillus sp. Q70]|uniref:ribokinase n=1 Tax=Amphibacillus sp. Q70 TaxID=3453416 RepID=UPI003F8426DD
MNKPKITVIGSINLDMVTSTDHVPVQGETLMGQNFEMIPGGKGANQAVAAARLGADVNMIGRVGDDLFGQLLLDNLVKNGVNNDGVKPVTDCHSGIATIIVSDHDNRIIVTPGANEWVTPQYVERFLPMLLQSDYVILQLEIPLETIEYVTGYCYENEIKVILNPAPIQPLPEVIQEQVTYLTPNESEVKGVQASPDQLIVTLGKEGVKYYDEGKAQIVKGYRVEAVDTTGAGDTFNGALAVGLAQGWSIKQAIQFANAAGALSVQTFGAQDGMPTLEEVKRFLQVRERFE